MSFVHCKIKKNVHIRGESSPDLEEGLQHCADHVSGSTFTTFTITTTFTTTNHHHHHHHEFLAFGGVSYLQTFIFFSGFRLFSFLLSHTKKKKKSLVLKNIQLNQEFNILKIKTFFLYLFILSSYLICCIDILSWFTVCQTLHRIFHLKRPNFWFYLFKLTY